MYESLVMEAKLFINILKRTSQYNICSDCIWLPKFPKNAEKNMFRYILSVMKYFDLFLSLMCKFVVPRGLFFKKCLFLELIVM